MNKLFKKIKLFIKKRKVMKVLKEEKNSSEILMLLHKSRVGLSQEEKEKLSKFYKKCGVEDILDIKEEEVA